MPDTPVARLLIVDDEAAQMKAVHTTLQAEGYSVIGFTSALAALAALRESVFDLVITDLTMPEMDGVAFLRAALEIDPTLAGIVMTGHGTFDTAVQAMQAGAIDYILKPFRLTALLSVLTRSLAVRRVRMENMELLRTVGMYELNQAVAQAKAAQEIAEARAALAEELEQKNRELEAANRAKSVFLSTMSHEIRTPMNAILGYAQLMSRDPGLGADAKANLRIIGRSGEHLLTLINDVLDMSRIEAGRTELNSVTFNLSALLNDLAALFRLRAETKALRFEMLADGESVPYIVGDEGKIRQALVNLLGNAIKFTDRGRVTLRVTLHQRNANQLWLSARVEDTGAGITDEEQQKLFEPFTQARRGRETQKGTGLGLAITRSFARLMGGDVTVSSSPGRGSVFHLEIPVGRGNAGVAVRQDVPRRVVGICAGIRAGANVPRILVVDDQTENRDWLMKLLAFIGFSVRGAENGEEAIRTWEKWSPQLILMDLHMPVMDGLEATRRIKSDPLGKDTAIVVLTASAMNEDRRTVAESGADGFLSKPFLEDDLLEKMRTLLSITYDYEEGQTPAEAKARGAERLGELPPAMLEELRNAIFSGSLRRLNELIREVRETADAASASALQELADNYDYDALTLMLDEAKVLPVLGR
jgi:signal transduction histidine kinase